MDKCPRCGSSAPHMHPAVQHGGEVEVCTHDFHLTPTNQNTAEYIANVHKARRTRALAMAYDPEGRVWGDKDAEFGTTEPQP